MTKEVIEAHNQLKSLVSDWARNRQLTDDNFRGWDIQTRVWVDNHEVIHVTLELVRKVEESMES